MVRDGYYYGLVMLGAAVLVGWLTSPVWAVVPVLLAAFFLWFFRDPERVIPVDAGAVVSPADGKVTAVSTIAVNGKPAQRISIFLNVFNVHVNRSPVAGVIRGVRYQTGKYLNAMNALSAEQNEQNMVTVEGDGHTVTFKQIAGLLARRIVFTKKIGDRVERGERVGLIKFGSRVDVVLETSAEIGVKVGDHVKGGSSILAFLKSEARNWPGLRRDVRNRERADGRGTKSSSSAEKTTARRAGCAKACTFCRRCLRLRICISASTRLQQITQGSLAEYWHFDHAAMAIGFAVLFDGLDGRIARMTNTTSDFGRELDSLADVITFGVAPAFLAWMWGFRSISPYISYPDMVVKLSNLGAIAGFAFLIAGASRLARFNITTNPEPSNPGRPGKKIFCGDADSRRGGCDCGGGALYRRRSAGMVGDRGHLAGGDRDRCLPDGQYLALL